MIDGPDELNIDSDAVFTCKTLSTYKPSVNMTFRLESNGIDHFDDLVQAGLAEVQDNPIEVAQNLHARNLTINSELLWSHCNIGRTIQIECSVEEDCHGKRVYNSISKSLTLVGKLIPMLDTVYREDTLMMAGYKITPQIEHHSSTS